MSLFFKALGFISYLNFPWVMFYGRLCAEWNTITWVNHDYPKLRMWVISQYYGSFLPSQYWHVLHSHRNCYFILKTHTLINSKTWNLQLHLRNCCNKTPHNRVANNITDKFLVYGSMVKGLRKTQAKWYLDFNLACIDIMAGWYDVKSNTICSFRCLALVDILFTGSPCWRVTWWVSLSSFVRFEVLG